MVDVVRCYYRGRGLTLAFFLSGELLSSFLFSFDRLDYRLSFGFVALGEESDRLDVMVWVGGFGFLCL